MANKFLNRLRESDKKGLFNPTQTSISYPTGFIPFDYRNGYMIEVRDLNETLLDSYPSVGVVGGTFLTIIGKSGVAKTTFAAQLGAHIVNKFEDNAFVQHYDLEQALTYTRIKNITGMTQQQLDDKYVLKQERNYIEDIYEAIMAIALQKESSKSEFTYDTGLKDEFNRKIIAYIPTVIILDSIPTLASADASNAMEGGTYANRVSKAIAQFYKRLMPIIKTYNINVIAVNHINQKIDINPMQKTQPQLLYLKMDEVIPGGHAAIYYANVLVKFIAVGASKYTEEKDGFDGVMIRCEFLKSRTNKAGQSCNLIYNQLTGFDTIMTQYQFAKDNGLIEGKNPSQYITGSNIKFNSRNFRKSFIENEKLRMALFDNTLPILEKQLSHVEPDDANNMSITEIFDRLQRTQENVSDEISIGDILKIK